MNKFAIATALLSAAGATAVTLAGAPNLLGPVSISPAGDGSMVASGSLDAARASVDTVQFIGCTISTDTHSTQSVSCSARDSRGTQLACVQSAPTFAQLAAVASVGRTSFIRFGAAASKCTFITVDNDSANL
ncbi:MAG: hypothetical protein JSR66_02305 [Proteobacteria bacterium]|nr:hypothetical protein [Pseudomonadota bacterium]